MREGEFGTRAELEAFQRQALRALVDAVADTNAFYRRHWQALGPRPSCATPEDFRGSFPFTRKHDLVADQSRHPPYGTNLTFPVERYTRCHGTSGSTGQPLRWLDTPESWQWMLGNWRRVYAAAGVGPGDRVFFAFSFGPFLGFWTAFEAAESLGCLCLPGGGLATVARLRSILEQRATVLCCTPTYALHLARTAAAEGLDLGRGAVRSIIVAGEPGGSIPALRRSIESQWPGARVTDHHGMTEVGPVSYECPGSPGLLHVIESAYLAEVVDPRTGAEIGAGETGELVLTTLGRVGSPLLRYRTGDLVRPVTGGRRCACGTWDLGLEGGILGRTDDMVVIRGVNVFPGAVEEVVREVPGTGEYRVEIRTTGALLELQVDVEPATAATDGARMGQALAEAFRERLSLRVPVRVVEAGSLPRFEMKARRWIRTGGAGGEG